MAKERPKAVRYRHWQSKLFISGICLLSLTAAASAPQISPVGGWHLVRTANPAGTADPVSMNRSADISSGLDLAGLMLRCHGGGAEVVLVVVTPFSPHARPAVTIGANGMEWRFEASVIPPGAQLLLPATAATLVAGPWQSANQLAVKISWQVRSISGAIPIDGLTGALATLIANCPPS